jgi:hypothetical protein
MQGTPTAPKHENYCNKQQKHILKHTFRETETNIYKLLKQGGERGKKPADLHRPHGYTMGGRCYMDPPLGEAPMPPSRWRRRAGAKNATHAAGSAPPSMDPPWGARCSCGSTTRGGPLATVEVEEDAPRWRRPHATRSATTPMDPPWGGRCSMDPPEERQEPAAAVNFEEATE